MRLWSCLRSDCLRLRSSLLWLRLWLNLPLWLTLLLRLDLTLRLALLCLRLHRPHLGRSSRWTHLGLGLPSLLRLRCGLRLYRSGLRLRLSGAHRLLSLPSPVLRYSIVLLCISR